MSPTDPHGRAIGGHGGLLSAVLSLGLMAGGAGAATTISPTNLFAYGANLGWVNARADGVHGAVIGEFFCAGYLYAANVGWIHLGDGQPADGIRYRSESAADYGVNHDGRGNLRGFAWSPEIGWLTFTNRDARGAFFDGPQVDLRTGRLSGAIWSANCGWIALSNVVALVQTGWLEPAEDSDGDGIPDAWERHHAGSLASLSRDGDSDGDGQTDYQEYEADTHPLDPASQFRITQIRPDKANSVAITWSSRASRLYALYRCSTWNPQASWRDSGLGVVSSAWGTNTTRTLALIPEATQEYYRVRVLRPLPPPSRSR
ncbi:MAG TPA: thrombospondin type 3 repeat-containing protein [Methylomirabilota bacterium]|nr:thrombospondin type 3 repeat-containing protein [Methylomirabilota bacterium]